MRKLLLLLFLLSPFLMSAQGSIIEWETVFNGLPYSRGHALEQMPNGHFLVGSGDGNILEFDQNGNYIGIFFSDGTGQDNRFVSIEKTQSGNYLCTKLDPGYNTKGILLSPTGTAIYNQSINNGQSGVFYGIETTTGNFAFSAIKNCGGLGGGWDARVFMKNNTFNTSWDNLFCVTCGCTGSFCDFGNELIFDIKELNGNFYVTGYQGFGGTGCYFPSRMYMLKINPSGNLVAWDTLGGINPEAGYSLTITPNNDIMVLGYTESFGAGGQDFWLVKMDTNFNVLSDTTFGTSLNEEGRNILATQDGGYLLSGMKQNSNGNNDIWFIKLDLQGNVEWDLVHGDQIESDYFDGPRDVIEVAPNKFVATYMRGVYGSSDKLVILKINGCQIQGYDPLPDTLITCANSGQILDAGAGYSSYLWSTGDTGSSIIVNTEGEYSVAVTDTAGCVGYDTVYVSVLDATIQQQDTTICIGDSVELSLEGFNTNNLCTNNNYSLQFDGVDDYVETNNSPNWYTGNEFTWSLWVYLSDINSDQLFIKHGTANGATGNGAYFNYFSQRVIFTSPLNGAEGVMSPINVIPQNTWTHLSIVVELNQVTKLYVNGQDVSLSAYNGILTSIAPPTTSMVFGRDVLNNQQSLNGRLDDILIWNIALDSNQIQQYMYCPPTGNEPDLVGYWNFEEGTGTTTADQTFNGNNGSLMNGVTWSTDVPSIPNSSSSILWSTGDTTASINVSPAQTTTYYVTVSNGSSSCTDSVTITVNDPQVDLGPDQSICQGDSVLLDAGVGYDYYSWNTGDTTQTIYASQGGSYDATVGYETPVSNNYSLEFDGVDDYVEIQDNSNLDLDQSNFTIFSWVKLRQFSEEGIFDHLDINNVSCGRLNFRINVDGTLRLFLKDDNCNSFYASTYYTFSDTNWHHIAVTFDYNSENVVFIIDGIIESHIVGASGLVSGINPANNLHLGAYGSSFFSNSNISSVAFWSTALSQAEIQQYMNCPPTGNEPGLVGYWNFEEGTGTTANDLSGNGNHGTLVNGPNWSTNIPTQTCVSCTATDSVYVSILQPSTSSISPTACDSYTAADGQTYSSTGNYTAVIQNAAGCDSTISINLTINNSSTGTETQTACNSFTWPANTQTYTASGQYTTTLTNANGCDSVVTLDLSITTLDTAVSLTDQTITALQNSGLYQWLDCDSAFAVIVGETSQSFTATSNGSYAVALSDNNCLDTSACILITSVAVQTLSEGQSVRLYPNPTNAVVHIDFDLLQDKVELILFDAAGKKILEQEYQQKQQITLSLPEVSGVYLIQLKTRLGEAVFPVIKRD